MEVSTLYSPVKYNSKSLTPYLLTRFMNWCSAQQEHRLLWLGLILAAHGCVLTPLTVMMVTFSGNSLFLFMLAIAAMGMTLVTNLAALPTKITVPVFVLSILIDLAIVISCAFLMV